MVGASFGALGGVLLDAALPDSWDIQAGVYALVGAAAALCALFRSNISLVVILVEGTSGISFLPGILAAIIISNFIAQYVHPDGVYEGELERDGRVVFLRQEPPAALRWRTAERIAACPVIGFCRIEDVSRVLRVLKSSTHNGFPVHNPIDPGEDPVPKLEGFVLRSQLLVLLQEQAFCDANGAYLDAPPDVVAYEARLQALMDVAKLCSDGLGGALEHRLDPLAGQGGLESTVGASPAMLQTLETLQSLQTVPNLAPFLGTPTPDGASPSGSSAPMLSPALYLNLTPFLDRGVITVRPDTPAVTIHRLFVGLSLRHLCVTDAQSRVTGIITRRDLDHAGGKGWWRSSKMAPQPAHLGRVLRGSSGSWLSASLHALMASQRGVSDLFQRLNLSPKSPRVLTSDGAQHSAWSYARDTEQGSLPAADTEDQRSPLLWSPFGN
jgi:chloride channel 7